MIFIFRLPTAHWRG